ncbi:putative amidoligase domain-containing protein [Paenibacillus sp. sgz302251]|uniref:putative amidoligase domain-containing protein n=1 Tax=Paenibacillus sp. sgz302251 TaxID=3414493 RepID=UPI003C7BE112
MASTWIWRGSYDRLELVAYGRKSVHTSGEWNGQPLHAQPWTNVKAGDAVLAWSDARAIDSRRFPGAWVLNVKGFAAVRMMDGEKQRVWKRAGLCGGKSIESERLYLVSVIHLEPVQMKRIDHMGKSFQELPIPCAEDGLWKAGRASMEGRASVGERRELAESYEIDNGGFASSGQVIKDTPAGVGADVGVSARMRGSVTAGHGIGQWPEDPVLRRVARTAVQALYALGLDIGEAEVALGGDGRTAVRAAWPKLRDTRLEEAMLRRFAAWHAAARAEAAVRRPLLIGADPEFVLVTPAGKVAAASRFFGEGVGGAAGADAVLIGRRLLYPVAELRPEPAEDPAALAANVRRLLLRAADRISDPSLRWAAGAMPVPGLALGGHIHISGAPLTSRLLRLLDSFAAFPLAMVEDPAGRARRPRYGILGDFRQQPHGGFEYRTLPSWLISPAAAKAAFALALLCAREAMSITYIPALEERYVEAYYAGDRSELTDCLDAVASSISATDSYAALEPYIEPLLEAARRGATWNEAADIRSKWRIPFVR